MFTGLFGNSPTYAYAADKINYMEKVVKQKESVQPWGFYVEKLLLTIHGYSCFCRNFSYDIGHGPVDELV